MITIFYITIFLIGLAFGSFFNVCIYRIPNKESIVFPPSHCPVCKKRLKPWQNIPLLSYILLGGKCYYCKSPIPFRYFFVEFITPILFIYAFYINHQNPNFQYLANVIFISFSIIIFFIDYDKGIIPDVLTYPLILIGLMFSLLKGGITPLQSLIGGIGIFAFLFLMAYACEVIKKRNCIGGGDLKYLAAIGVFFGIFPVFFILFIASILAILFVIVVKHNLKKSFPFGPFIALASLIYLFWGKDIIAFYINTFLNGLTY